MGRAPSLTGLFHLTYNILKVHPYWPILHNFLLFKGWTIFPSGASSKELTCQCGRHKRCRFSSWEDPLEEVLATHSNILARRIPKTGTREAAVHRAEKSQTRLNQLGMHAYTVFSLSIHLSTGIWLFLHLGYCE